MPAATQKLPKSRELLSRAWSAYTKNWLTFWKYLLPYVLGLVVVELLMANESTAILGGLLYFAVLVYIIWMSIVLTRISYQTMEGKSPNEAKAKENAWKRFWPLVGVGIVTSIVSFVGLMFFIVPGVILALMYFAAQYGVIIDNQKVHESIYKSVEMTSGRKANMFWTLLWAILVLVLIGLALFGIIASIVSVAVNSSVAPTSFSIIVNVIEGLLMPWSLGILTGVYLALKKA